MDILEVMKARHSVRQYSGKKIEGEIRETLAALGDENRQHLILEMMKMENCDGARVGDITERTHLSRPAVSHHLQIRKNAGILKVRKEATKNYYYFDPDTRSFDRMIRVLQRVKEITAELPDRSGRRE